MSTYLQTKLRSSILLALALTLAQAPHPARADDFVCNGCIDEADLSPVVRARLDALESRIAAIEGGPYSNATFYGTYRCHGLYVEEYGSADGAGNGYASVVPESDTDLITADGLGSMTVDYSGTSFERTWWVGWYAAGGWHYLANEENTDTFNGTVTVSYTVSAEGRIETGLSGEETFEGWISPNGDTAVFRDYGPNSGQDGHYAGILTCVRTAQ